MNILQDNEKSASDSNTEKQQELKGNDAFGEASPIASQFPNWDLMPPTVLVRRSKKTK